MGAYSGGQGVVREIEFRAPLTVSILSERRAFAPWGGAGAGGGARGRNTLLRLDQSSGKAGKVSLGGKASFAAFPGDVLRVETPGGGGYGVPAEAQAQGQGQAQAQGQGAEPPFSFLRQEVHAPQMAGTGSLSILAETECDF